MQLFNCSANTKCRFDHNGSENPKELAASANRIQDDILMVLDQMVNKLQGIRSFLKDKTICVKINEIQLLLKQINDHSNLLKDSNVSLEGLFLKLDDLKNHEYCKLTEQARSIKNKLKRGFYISQY